MYEDGFILFCETARRNVGFSIVTPTVVTICPKLPTPPCPSRIAGDDRTDCDHRTVGAEAVKYRLNLISILYAQLNLMMFSDT
jgi:hypothetical protein